MKVFFCMQIRYQTILQFDTINLGEHGQAIPAQITQSNKFSKTLQYLKKEVRDEFDFYCNEHHNFLNDTTIFDECGQYTKRTQNKNAVSFAISQK